MSMSGSMENLRTAQETQPIEQAIPLEQPPALERKEPVEQAGDLPPAFGRREGTERAGDAPPKVEREDEGELTLGESVEHYCARHQLASDIKNGRRIAAENSAKKLANIEAKEASK